MIHNLGHPIILGLPWLELHNPGMEWRKQVIRDSPQNFISTLLDQAKSDSMPHEIAMISLEELRDKGQEEMLIFSMITTPCTSTNGPKNLLPTKYQEFGDVFDKVKANTLPEHLTL